MTQNSAFFSFRELFQGKDSRFILPAFAWFFCILGGYFVIRPLREVMGVESGTASLSWLFLATFVAMLAAVPVYAACVARLTRTRLVSVVYHFFVINLGIFWLLLQWDEPEVRVWVARAFFVWVSVFGVYSTSVFWSVLTDLLNSSDAKRAFGMIAAGGTSGAIAGSLVASFLSLRIETHHLLFLPMLSLELGLVFASLVQRQAVVSGISPVHPAETKAMQTAAKHAHDDPVGGGLWDGISRVVRSRYLAAICGSLFLGQLAATYAYFQQAEIVKASISDKAAQTKYFADVNLGVQLLTLVLQASVAALLTRRAGFTIAMVATPLVFLVTFLTPGVSTTLWIFAIADVIRRGLAYGVAVPTREILFTVVSREDKYKSKGFIDTVILRGGDAISSQLLTGVAVLLGSGWWVHVLMLPAVALWTLLNFFLARWQRQLSSSTDAHPS